MKSLILAADGFEDLELFCPLYRLQEEGVDVTVATPLGQAVTGTRGYRAAANSPLSEINSAEYDLLIVPGGGSPERLRLREEAVAAARMFMEEGRRVAVLSKGPQLLISAGALNGRQLTSAPGIRDDLRAAGAFYRDDAVVLDGNLLSCRGIADLPEFCRQLIALLAVRA